MKAKVIKTGKIVNVIPVEGGWCDTDFASYSRHYEDKELDFDFRDWESFRREAAKDILATVAGQLVNDPRAITIDEFDPEFYAKVAVEWADALIAKLKEK